MALNGCTVGAFSQIGCPCDVIYCGPIFITKHYKAISIVLMK